MLSVTTLGGFSLSVFGKRVELKSKKSQALLAYLLLNTSPTEMRERLSGLLWSEFPEDKARASLRQILHGMQENLTLHGFRGLHLERQAVTLERREIAFDIALVFDQLEQGEVPASLTSTDLPADSLLAGFDGLDPAFDVWLAIQRRLLRERLERALLGLVEPNVSEPVLIAAATALMNIDQTNEYACRKLMEARASRGELSAALKIYNRLWDHLGDEYDMEPSPETQALAVRLKSDPGQGADDSTALSTGHVQSRLEITSSHPQRAVVVAPFDARGVGAEFSYLVAGLRQDLIAKLVRFREWVIIDGQHVRPGPDSEFARRWPRQIWIDALLAQAGKQLKITLSVREQPAASLIWSDSLRFNLDSWFDIEREILARLAVTMNLHISTARLVASSGAPDVPVEIYDRWLRGQSIIMNWRPERDRAREIYRGILADAPNFSPAHSSLAQLESSEHLALPGVFRTSEREIAGLEHSKQAVRLDPFDSRAHLALGWASAMNRQFDQAAAAFETALELNENDPWTINSAALGGAYCGNVDRAIAVIDRAPALGLKPAPFHAAYQGAVRFVAGDFANAVDAYNMAGDIIGDLGAWKAASLAHLGRLDEARNAANDFVGHVRSRWAGAEPATENRMSAWFLHCFPIRDRRVWESLREGIGRAGIDVAPIGDIPRHP
ncbi:MAG: tetratricopeptide repeat protein [Rhizobiales bacterium]|nr:tetratricopeptide repeat protein [Hyphomicrobiales bacterium]